MRSVVIGRVQAKREVIVESDSRFVIAVWEIKCPCCGRIHQCGPNEGEHVAMCWDGKSGSLQKHYDSEPEVFSQGGLKRTAMIYVEAPADC